MLVGDISSRSSPNVMAQAQSSEMSTPEKSQCPENGMSTLYSTYVIHDYNFTTVQIY